MQGVEEGTNLNRDCKLLNQTQGVEEGTNLNRDCKLLNQTQGVEEGTKSLDQLFFHFWASSRREHS